MGETLAATGGAGRDAPCRDAACGSRSASDGANGSSGGGSRGIFITFEGGDGVGKSTHIHYLAHCLEQHGAEVVCLREPGGTAVGEALRAVVLDPSFDDMADEAELLIYEAARAQIVAQVIEPALERGAVVLCDRFCDSTVAYQSCGRGLDRAFVEAVNRFASRGLSPDRTILLSCDQAHSALDGEADRIEGAGLAFYERVRHGFADLAAAQLQRIRVVSSDRAPVATAQAIFAELADLFSWMSDFEVTEQGFEAVRDEHRARRNGAAPGSDEAACG